MAAPLPEVARCLGAPLEAVEAAAQRVEPYIRGDHVPIWSIELVGVQLGLRKGHYRSWGREQRRRHRRRRAERTAGGGPCPNSVEIEQPATTVRTVGLDVVLVDQVEARRARWREEKRRQRQRMTPQELADWNRWRAMDLKAWRARRRAREAAG